MSVGLWLKEVLENAPTEVRVNPELRGWLVKDAFTEYVCAKCAARAMARGCWKWNGPKASPVWMDSPDDGKKCCCCEE